MIIYDYFVKNPDKVVLLNEKLDFDLPPGILDDYVDDFKEEIANPPSKDDIIGQGILLWRMVNSVIRNYQDSYN